jgi:hypothetical protein
MSVDPALLGGVTLFRSMDDDERQALVVQRLRGMGREAEGGAA